MPSLGKDTKHHPLIPRISSQERLTAFKRHPRLARKSAHAISTPPKERLPEVATHLGRELR